MTTMTVSASPALPLPRLTLLGVFFWFLAAMAIRFFGPSLLVRGSLAPMFVFLATIPLTWGLLRLAMAMGRVRGAAVLPALAVMSLVAMMLDGVALTRVPQLYGVAPDAVGMAAAWLLWGVAWTFVWAFYRREASNLNSVSA